MRLVDQIISCDVQAKAGEVSTRLRSEAPYFRKQQFEAHWLLEIIAQAAAAISRVVGLATGAPPTEKPPLGFLIAIRSFYIEEAAVQLSEGEELLSKIRFEFDMETIGYCSGEIYAGDGLLLARSEMTFLSAEAGIHE